MNNKKQEKGILVAEWSKQTFQIYSKVKFNATKLKRAEKGALSSLPTENDELPTKRYTRLNNDEGCSPKDTCFFCEKPGSEKNRLHEV